LNVSITISLPMKLLTEIEENIEGKNRATKIRKCLKNGYEHLLESQPLE